MATFPLKSNKLSMGIKSFLYFYRSDVDIAIDG
jgi:hypothetical protein